MCDPGEEILDSLKREFFEEVLNHLYQSDEKIQKDKDLLQDLFQKGELVTKLIFSYFKELNFI